MAADMSEQKSEVATLQVGSEEVKLNMAPSTGPRDDLDLKDRDPNDMNADVKTRFHDIFGEPDKEIYSFDKIWILSYKVFGLTKLWCYRITSLICALPCAVCWGLSFACVSFFRIWCCIPCLRSCDIEMYCIRRVVSVVLQTWVAPCAEALGMFFANIRIKLTKAEV